MQLRTIATLAAATTLALFSMTEASGAVTNVDSLSRVIEQDHTSEPEKTKPVGRILLINTTDKTKPVVRVLEEDDAPVPKKTKPVGRAMQEDPKQTIPAGRRSSTLRSSVL
jgi:hypothetical protein